MSQHAFFLSIIIILLIILLIKIYSESKSTVNNKNSLKYHKLNSNNLHGNNLHSNVLNANLYDLNNYEYEKMIEEVQKETIKKINYAVEQGYSEGFKSMNVEIKDNMDDITNIGNFYKHNTSNNEDNNTDNNTDTYNNLMIKNNKNTKHKNRNMTKHKNNNNDNIISYLNKGNISKLMLFYKSSCNYCSEFMPLWYKIVNNLSNDVLYEEIDCEKDFKKANEYQINTVPTIILLVNNEKKTYIGDRTYLDIMKFLKYNGVNIVEKTFEEFYSTGYDIEPEVAPKNISNCPAVTFDTELDIDKDKYMFQIFNADGQYGYAVGGIKEGNILSPFTAAYSTIDSYLSSLPESANISECANNYSNQIRSFGLCDTDKLDEILEYKKNVDNKNAVTRFDGTDYSTNNDVVTAIKNACRL